MRPLRRMRPRRVLQLVHIQLPLRVRRDLPGQLRMSADHVAIDRAVDAEHGRGGVRVRICCHSCAAALIVARLQRIAQQQVLRMRPQQQLLVQPQTLRLAAATVAMATAVRTRVWRAVPC